MIKNQMISPRKTSIRWLGDEVHLINLWIVNRMQFYHCGQLCMNPYVSLLYFAHSVCCWLNLYISCLLLYLYMILLSFYRLQGRWSATNIAGVDLLKVGNSQLRNWGHEASEEGVGAGSLLACQMGLADLWMKWKKCTWSERNPAIGAEFSHNVLH